MTEQSRDQVNDDPIQRAAEVMCREVATLPGRETLPFPCPHCIESAEALNDAGMLVNDETINAAIKDRVTRAMKAMNSNPDHLRDQVRALSRQYDEETR